MSQKNIIVLEMEERARHWEQAAERRERLASAFRQLHYDVAASHVSSVAQSLRKIALRTREEAGRIA